MNSILVKRLIVAGSLTLAIACLCNFYLFLGKAPIENWDEARHGVSAYEMLHSSEYLINTYQNVPDYWYAKPPLSFWAIVAGFKIFGITPFGFRFASAFCSVITVLMIVVFAGKRLSWMTGLLSGGILITLNDFVLRHNVRHGDPDALFIMLTTGAILAAFQMKKHFRWVYLSCFLLSLAFLTKSFHVIPATLIVFGLAFWIRKKKILSFSSICMCLLCGLVPVLLWCISRYMHDGTIFFEKMFYYDLIQRSTTVIEGHKKSLFYYFKLLLKEFDAIIAVTMIGLLTSLAYVYKSKLHWRESIRTLDSVFLWQLLFCSAVPVLLFSCAASKLRWYCYPAYPFFSILLATGITVEVQALWVLLRSRRARSILVLTFVLFWGMQEGLFLYRMTKAAQKPYSIQMKLQKLAQSKHSIPLYLEEGHWEQRDVLAARLYGNFIPKEGGRNAWEQDTSKKAMLLSGEDFIQY